MFVDELMAKREPTLPDLLCLCHLRWDFVYQRPQHLMTRFAKERRVFFLEEPVSDEGPARLDMVQPCPGLWVAVPHLPKGLGEDETVAVQKALLNDMVADWNISEYVLWYYTPMALPFTCHLEPLVVIYDCMDELSAFNNAPASLREREADLLNRVDVVLTGGHSLYEAKRDCHPNVHAFPSSVDVAHFATARTWHEEPGDQAAIPHPRLGFFGVLDERIDLSLIHEVAAARPQWQLIFVGPVVKIDRRSLPAGENLHYLGIKPYDMLPAYLAGWDIALLPFARNEATRFISPTKTPEYLAAGKPVVSTSIRDVVRPYSDQGLVRIADSADVFVLAVEAALQDESRLFLQHVDEFLGNMSWDRTWAGMRQLLQEAVELNRNTNEVLG